MLADRMRSKRNVIAARLRYPMTNADDPKYASGIQKKPATPNRGKIKDADQTAAHSHAQISYAGSNAFDSSASKIEPNVYQSQSSPLKIDTAGSEAATPAEADIAKSASRSVRPKLPCDIWPLDFQSARRIASSNAFWAIALLASLPLIFLTLQGSEYQLNSFAVFFAVIWGFIFRLTILSRVEIRWRVALACAFLVAFAGVPAAIVVEQILWVVFNQPDSGPNTLLGAISLVGIPEELIKLIPVVALAYFIRSLGYRDIILLGVTSGLAFSAAENLAYFHSLIAGGTQNAVTLANQGATIEEIGNQVANDVGNSIVITLTRSMSAPFGHAIWSAIAAHFIAAGRGWGSKRIVLAFFGLSTAATLHGIYDWLLGIEGVLASGVLAFSLLLLEAHLSKSTDVERQPELILGVAADTT
jgi:RsiW-degrading membrane proteinase PrsW (M82 family)